MLFMTFAVDCSMLHGCPHVGHGFGGHGFAQVSDPANAGMANTIATADTNTNATIFLIVIPPLWL
jgi:hypothetical protein